MKIRQYIKRMATLALMVALLAPLQEVWGQEKGNKYSLPVYYPTVQNSDFSNSGRAFDGNTSNYASTSSRVRNAYFNLDIGTNGLTKIVVRCSSNNNRPNSLTIYASDDGSSWGSAVQSVSLSSNTQTITLNTPITKPYVRLYFTSNNSKTYGISEITLTAAVEASIQHKPAKWHSFRGKISDEAKAMDTFDDSNKMFEAVMSSSEAIQAAHTYIDTIYMHKGTSIVLNLPDKMDNGNLSSTSYQRWYSYRTGLTFATGETGNNAVVDLLTPIDDGTFYRFGNGYVGSPIGTNMHRANFYFPKDGEYKEWFGDNYAQYLGNSWYVVACDVSLYNDFAKDYRFGGTTFSATDPWEPTLSHRIIFYICAVEPPAPDEDGNPVEDVNWYRKAVNSSDYSGSGTKYLEEYDISFPYTRVSNNTLDLVALSKDARSYAVPVGADSDSDELTVTLIDGTGNEASGIKLASTVVPNGNGTNNDYVGKQNIHGDSYTISGNTRAIQFQYPNLQSDGTRRVNNVNAKATILVTKEVNGTSYHIAKFNLTFVPETRLLTQSQLAGAGTSSQWYFRTDDYISKNFELLTSLDFDYSKSVPTTAYPNGNAHFYPFPMSWGSNSYGFYDGAPDNDMLNMTQLFPQWGYYSLMDNFIETDHWDAGQDKSAQPLDNSTYHLYVDASDRPGVIARLEFERQLCKGAELFVTAWVKSCVWNADDLHSDAGMLFTIMGVTEDGRYVPIYRHNTGQIRQTNFLKDNTNGYHNNIVDYQPVTITGSDNNEWYQVYFSFINKNELSFNKYVLQIDNNSLSTEGGDMYIDDIRVYMAMPNAYVEQLAPSCIGDATSIRLRIDWDRLLSRTGDEELQSGTETRNLSFCFVDRYAYEEALAGGVPDNEAIQAAMVAFSRDEEGGGEGTKIGTLKYDLYYEGNEIYDTSDSNRGQNGGDAFYRYQEEGNTEDRFLAIDLWATDLIPTRRYYLLIDETGSGTASNFAIANPCAIKTEFMVESTTLIKMNGQVVTPETEFCVGQVFNFTAQLRIDNGTEEGIPVTTPVYFDWFFGSVDDYLSTNNNYNVSIEKALVNFRGIYPDAETVSKEYTPAVSKDDYNFTEDMFDLLLEATTPGSGVDGGLNTRLVLRKHDLNISILKDGLFLVIRPIQTVIYDEEGEEVDPTLICWSYVPLNLKTTSEAPHANTGFWEVNQPDGYAAALRIGLKQIQSGKRLTLDLRDVECATEGATRLEMVTSTMGSEGQLVGVDLTDIFLVGTTDPDMQPYIDQSTSEYDLPIGKLIALNATEERESTMTIEFDLNLETNGFKFKPHEGYEYTFEVHFQEDIPNGTDKETIAACYGKMPVTMKVVPEYLVWNDTQKTDDYSTIGNWNNDRNWQRIPSDRIHAEKSDNSEYFTDGTNDTPNAFVPMLFSKVVIPANSKIWLYQAGYGEYGSWVNSDRPEEVADPTLNIQYDLMAFDNTNGLTTEHYRVSLLNQIHFEPGAEMLHAEYLLYDTAWVDYQLDKDRWYTLASPLKAVYAGDFYTDKLGTEGNEYFQPIYYSENDNSRFNPSVYQRGWKGSTTTLQLADNKGTKDVAVAGNWSALYNDVAEAYTPGTGFSLKVQDVTGNATFRLPKADGSYTYYSYDGQISRNTTPISRLEGGENVSGRLQSDQLFIRNTDLTDAKEGTPITITLSETAHGDYYLVGNPFMAHLDMNAFFDRNAGLVRKYWVVTDGNQSAAVGKEEDLTTTGTGDATVAPLQSFFVQKAEGVTGAITLTFTQDMQTLGGTGDGLRSANALTITATTSDGRTSRAAVAYSGMATDDYQSSEDAELFLDSNLGDVPMVYTVAGTMASSINVRQNCELVPLGVYGARNEQVTLRFDQVGVFSGVKLYDTKTKNYTTLTDGSEVSVSTNDYGRYYLTGGVATDNEAIRSVDDISIYSVRSGEIVATSAGSSLRSVRVYGIGGELVTQQSLANQSVYRLRVPGNAIYVVYAEDMDGIIRNVKLRVR